MSSGGRPQETDFELNLAPIIDCFTVLVTFMLASSSFLAMTWMEAQLPGSAASADASPKQPVILDVHLVDRAGVIGAKVGISGKSKSDVETQEQIEPAVRGLASTSGQVDGIRLHADPGVNYGHLVRVFERLRTIHPNVALGGGGGS